MSNKQILKTPHMKRIVMWAVARITLLNCLIMALFCTGCSQSGPKYALVTGKVMLKDGTPVKMGNIIFQPDKSKGNPSQEVCQGTIQNGEYSIRTGVRDGAPVGAYRVCIEAPYKSDEKNPYFTKWFAHEKYMNADRSKLTIDVTEKAEPGQYDFKLDPPAKKK